MPEISIAEAVFNPWVTILWLFILWLIIYLIFLGLKVSDRTLKKLELIYLLIGFLGVLGVVIDNREERLLREKEGIKSDIQYLTGQIQLHYDNFCFDYLKGPFLPNHSNEREMDREMLCEWGREAKKELLNDIIDYIPQKKLELVDKNQFERLTDYGDDLIKWYNHDVEQVNKLIQEYRRINAKITSDNLPFNIVGTLLLLIAISLRLAITSYNLKKMKKE